MDFIATDSGVAGTATGSDPVRPVSTDTAARTSPGARSTADATHNAGIALKSPVATSAAAPGDTTSNRLKRMRRCASDATHAQSATARRFIAPVVAFRATRFAEAPPTGMNNDSYVLQT